MPSDRARVSFDPTRQYRGLVAQQGRVTLEADWNEAVAIAAERDRLVTLDVVGPLGTPDDGYAVSVIPPLGGSGAAPDLAIGAGTLYLGGERLELDEAITYSSQPDWLDRSTDLDWPSDAPPDGAAPSFELVYLVATEQEVSAVEDHELADVALGGPDTMQRLRMLQHVLRFPGDAETCAAAWLSLRRTLAGYGMAVDPATLRLGSTSSLQVGFANEPSTPSLCQPVATGGYLGAENQMIRVMVTDVESGVANIVWGYDDASFLYRLAPVSAPGAGASALALTLQSAPVDQYHEPAQNQYVELLRDAVALTASDWIASGLGYVSAVTATYDEATMQLSVSTAGTQGALSGAAFADYFSSATPQLYLRVWQQQLAAPPGSAVTLGDTGLTVTLNSSNGVFHPGDFWRFAVRPLEQQLVYPDRYLVAAQPPDGPLRFICPLAVLDWSGDTATVTACVPPFDSLTEISSEAGGCCTVEVGPGDVDDGAGLQRLLDRYVGRSAVTICLKPGTYTLTAPLEIGSQLELTLQGCAPGVVLQGPASPGKEFLLGLVAMQGAQGVTLRGLTVVAPAVAFESEEDSFSGLTAANRELLVAYARDLQVAICISLDGSSQLRIEGCALELPGGVSSNLLAAGILATGAIEGFELAGCQVSVSDAPTATPFYDLLAGEQVEAPFAITVGYLQVPTFATEQSKALVPQSANAEAEAEAGGGGAAGAGGAAEAGEGGGGAAPNETVPAQDIALVRLEVLHDAVIEDCELEGLTWAVLVIAKLGTTRLDQIVVRDCYGGIVLVSIENPSLVATFDLLDSGGSDLLGDLEPYGLTTLLDRTIVMATSIARLLPAQPPESDATLVPGRLTPTADAVAAIRPVVVNLFGEVADVTGSGGGGGGGSGGAGGGGAAGSNPATTAPPSAATTAAPTAA
ncbi:MAG TPA: DUF6519 domain-containing protein, partial [Acidimicrobiales bacterium]|nr:DUF6519 domain-containing protein [Acidimicrobiales bacterium]